MEYRRAFQNLNMPPARYVLLYALPMLVAGGVFAFVFVKFVGGLFPSFLRIPAGLLVFSFSVAVAVLYPVTIADRKRTEIHDAIPFFMTHFGVLSTSNIPRAEIIRILGEKKAYKGLADEMMKIYSLVTNWNLSLPQACRFVSRTTPSHILGDFLDRLAHALETGQNLESFLRNEQAVVMKEYATLYETAIYRLENLKDIYMSTMMGGVFFIIFALITPAISGVQSTKLVTGSVILFAFLEILFLLLLKFRVPNDRLWHQLPIETPEATRIRNALVGSAAAAILLAFLLPRFTPLPTGLALALAVSPVAATGVFAELIEAKIKRREDNYGAFIRSVGASASARGGSLREVLRKIKTHNFGPLTETVHNLYGRLTWRLYDMLAWKHFSAESGSNLVQNFNDMFIEGIRAGGKPEAVGEIISDNVVRILNLRKARYSTAGTFRGLLLGFTAGMAFTLFIGIGMLEVLGDMFSALAPSQGVLPVSFDFDIDVSVVSEVLLWLVLFHALVAGVMLKMIDGGAWPAGLTNFVLMVWIGVIVSVVSSTLMGRIFVISAGATG
ncbi:MAG: type II secretion system F family protein [Methanobacteriota archaeon]